MMRGSGATTPSPRSSSSAAPHEPARSTSALTRLALGDERPAEGSRSACLAVVTIQMVAPLPRFSSIDSRSLARSGSIETQILRFEK